MRGHPILDINATMSGTSDRNVASRYRPLASRKPPTAANRAEARLKEQANHADLLLSLMRVSVKLLRAIRQYIVVPSAPEILDHPRTRT